MDKITEASLFKIEIAGQEITLTGDQLHKLLLMIKKDVYAYNDLNI